MPETVTAVQGQTVAPAISEFYGRPDAAGSSNEIDKDTFLKLLVAQLKYQDPLEPSSSEDFIATTAQFTTVEKLDELTKQGQNTALVNSLTTAGSLVGRTITFNGPDGVPVDAFVERSQILGGEVALVTDKGPVGLNQILGIGASGIVPVTTDSAPDATDAEEPATDATDAPNTQPNDEIVTDDTSGQEPTTSIPREIPS